MDKEFKKAVKQFLLLDTIIGSSNTLWRALDEIEDELEEMFGRDKNKEENYERFFTINKNDK